MKAVVTIKVTPNELQFLSAALECYALAIRNKKYNMTDLTPAERDPHKALTIAHKLLGDLDLK